MNRPLSLTLSFSLLAGSLLGCREVVGLAVDAASPRWPAVPAPWPPPPRAGAVAAASAPSASAPAPETSCETMRDCDGDVANRCETDVRSSSAHCGACGRACGDGLACVAGTCRTPRRIDAASRGVCAVVSGRVMCWGRVPGKGVTAVPVWIPGTEGAVSVATSQSESCAVLGTGKLVCWDSGGENVNMEGDVVDVAPDPVSSYRAMFVRSDGQLGLAPAPGSRSTDPADSPLSGVRALEGGALHTCALLENGTVSCWGYDSYTGGAGEVKVSAPGKVGGIDDAVQMSASDHTTCVARRSGKVTCWGRWLTGGFLPKSGRPPPEEKQALPVDIPGVAGVVEIAPGEYHVCARAASGKVLCWSPDARGRQVTGGAGVKVREGVVEVAGISDAIAIASGWDFSCAMLASGPIRCWGDASRGALGHGSMGEVTTPRVVAGVSGAREIGAGKGFSCAITGSPGQLTCWGTGHSRWEPGQGKPEVVKEAKGVSGLFVSEDGACFEAGGKLSCFAGDKRQAPFSAPPFRDAKKIHFAAPNKGVALLRSGQVVVWQGARSVPVPGLSDVVDVAVDHDGHFRGLVCAVRSSGKVGCVGYEGVSPFAKKPGKPGPVVEVANVSDAAGIAVSVRDYCVTRKTGQVACFTTNAAESAMSAARSATGTAARLEATEIAGITDAKQIVANTDAWCALRGDQTVMCWGKGWNGELGVGDFEDRKAPTAVPGLTGVTALSMGRNHACAIRTGGEVLCWGDNESLAAGQPEPPIQFTPVDVKMPLP